MKISSLFTRIAQLNLFCRKVSRAPVKDTKPASGADTYYVTAEPLIKRKVRKDMIGAPSFGDSKQGQLLNQLVPPARKSPPSLATLKAQTSGVGYMYARELPNLSYAQAQWVAWNMPLGLTVHTAMQHLYGAPYPQE